MVTPPESDQVTHPFSVVKQAAKVGTVAAIPGTLIGAYAGILRTNTPILFSLVSGAQWFAIGSTFWTVRASLLDHVGLQNWWNITRGAPLKPRTTEEPAFSEKVKASTISGGLTGAVLGAVFRGPRNVIPGTLMFSLFGFSGQHVHGWFDKRNTKKMLREKEVREEQIVEENWLQRAAKSKWSPMSILDDRQYEKMLSEQLMSVQVEIALIDDKIKEFREQKEKMKTQVPVVQAAEKDNKEKQ